MDKNLTRASATDSPGLGSRRHQRYSAVFKRVLKANRDGYFLEGVALLDSLITDRLASRLGYVSGEDPSEKKSCGQMCHDLLKLSAEKDPAFRCRIEDVADWVKARNHALHATAKALKTEQGQSFEELLEAHQAVLMAGIEQLRSFDALDVADRVRNGAKLAATVPNAFTPAVRGEPRRM